MAAVSKKRSLSDMQDVLYDNDTYRIIVLRVNDSEEELEKSLLQTALDLGINTPQDTATTFDRVISDVAALDIRPRSPENHIQSPSRASESTHTASDSSIEQQRHRKTPSLAATSITSAPSISSVSSKKSNYIKFKKGFRRFSTLRRRKSTAVVIPDVPPPPPPSTVHLLRPSLQPRAITADQAITISHPRPIPSPSTDASSRTPARRKVASIAYGAPPLVPTQPTFLPPLTPSPSSATMVASEPLAHLEPDDSALARSMEHPTLKKLRMHQSQEQLRFLTFKASQTRFIHTKHLQQKRNALATYSTTEQETEARHAEAMTNLEHRHLSAEIDLRRTLEMERQGCDVKLKHMQAYCNSRSNVPGMPERVVTQADYRQLEQQYHVRNGIDNLHASRINVLREKQGKQLERISAKQDAEMEKLEQDFEEENKTIDARLGAEEIDLEKEFVGRKSRLARRWILAEAIERRKLELETGEDFGPLPEIVWEEQGRDANISGVYRNRDSDSSMIISEKGGFDVTNVI